jgi:hypothetical protein
MMASSVPTFWFATDHLIFTGRQHLNEDVCMETVGENIDSISDMHDMLKYVKQKCGNYLPCDAIGACLPAFFHGRPFEPPDHWEPRKQSQGLKRDQYVLL